MFAISAQCGSKVLLHEISVGVVQNREGGPLIQLVVSGAGGRGRTGAGLVDPRDFKSLASANSATPA